LADRTRRRILLLLRDRQLTVREIAVRFDVSRPAISKHLRVLLGAGLVSVETEGRVNGYTFDVRRLRAVWSWLRQAAAHGEVPNSSWPEPQGGTQEP
jgi:DNA-binding transcriptional ArsR family regulator